MRAMFLQNAKGQQTSSLGLLNSLGKIRRSQFFPMHRKRFLRAEERRRPCHHHQNRKLVLQHRWSLSGEF